MTTGVGRIPGLLADLLADLAEEGAEVDAMVARLDPGTWARPTPAEGWTVAHQIAHLAWTDDQALLAVRRPEAFAKAARLAMAHPGDVTDEGARKGAQARPEEILRRWRTGREALATVLAEVPESTRVPWYGGAMAPASLATARLMETWAHGQDVADSLGLTRVPGERLRHVAHLGVRTRDYSFAVNGFAPPHGEFRVELTAPCGGLWAWGPDDADQRLTGDGVGFALLVTQRIHRDDAGLVAQGEDVERWLSIAQAFAGPPGRGRDPRH